MYLANPRRSPVNPRLPEWLGTFTTTIPSVRSYPRLMPPLCLLIAPKTVWSTSFLAPRSPRGDYSQSPIWRPRPWRSISPSHWFLGSSNPPHRQLDWDSSLLARTMNHHPFPLMALAFGVLQGTTVFSKLALHNAYHLVRIRQGNEWKTTFNTPSAHHEYLMPPPSNILPMPSPSFRPS